MDYLNFSFLQRMENMLGEEYPEFYNTYNTTPQSGLRVNTLKIAPEQLCHSLPYQLTPIPWTSNGFYYDHNVRPAMHPYYLCGLFYMQEPSAMSPASLLPIKPGDYVLDLCAAPGGKATELASKLQGKGLLVANDISNTRSKALLRNLELFGTTNMVVTNDDPRKLAARFPHFFNKILVDAPCSGEGMFRKEPAVARAWTADKPACCARLQQEILTTAISMLAPGGMLLYSTCTFSPLENEQIVDFILQNFPEMSLLEFPQNHGFASGNPIWGNGNQELIKTIRIWPHKSQGEGHFLALFQKNDSILGDAAMWSVSNIKTPSGDEAQLILDFLEDTKGLSWNSSLIEVRNGKAYLLPKLHLDLRGIQFLRHGLYLGELKKKRFEPSQPLALALGPYGYISYLDLNPEDIRVQQYLQGQTLAVDFGETNNPKGWQLVCIDGYPLGWGKLVDNILKNKYPAGWRK